MKVWVLMGQDFAEWQGVFGVFSQSAAAAAQKEMMIEQGRYGRDELFIEEHDLWAKAAYAHTERR